jgi:NAD(P)-dependent dehydrogenase (short-subunit alcohol dehydrogenase family)
MGEMMRLEHDVAVVTGASSGIGRAVALTFAQEGAKVACLDLQLKSRCEDETVDKGQGWGSHFY